jgi:hypothetical protein
MKIISYGYKIPELTDKDFWDSYNFDVTRLSTHNHDGINSPKINPGGIQVYGVTILNTQWTPDTPSGYYHDVPFPVGWNMVWTSGQPCPVQVQCRLNDRIAYLDSGRATNGLGVRIYSAVLLNNLSVGLY